MGDAAYSVQWRAVVKRIPFHTHTLPNCPLPRNAPLSANAWWQCRDAPCQNGRICHRGCSGGSLSSSGGEGWGEEAHASNPMLLVALQFASPSREPVRDPNRGNLEPLKPETPKTALYLVLAHSRLTLQVVCLGLAHFRSPVRPAKSPSLADRRERRSVVRGRTVWAACKCL
jgi:hypothetical protein